MIEDYVYRLTWHRADHDKSGLRDHLITAIIESGCCVVVQDRQFNYIFIANLPNCWHVPSHIEPSDQIIFGDYAAAGLAQLKARIAETGEPGQLELRHQEQVFRFRVKLVDMEAGELHFVIAIDDLTEERRRERLFQTLLREVNHRSRNLLAIIQSVAVQTARRAETLETFLQKFRGRLYSLSRSHDLITDASWNGTPIFDLVRLQSEMYLTEGGQQIVVDGENVLLSPNAALHIGLALHELIANSIAHGALADGNADMIVITSGRVKVDEKLMIEIRWQETTGSKPDRVTPNFGSVVLERVVPASVSGAAEYLFGESKVDYRLLFPSE